MRCKCGYLYPKELRQNFRKVESYAVVRHADYMRFLKAEAKVLGSRSEAKRLDAMLRSAPYVGVLLRCPKCSRLLLIEPEKVSPEGRASFYSQDDRVGADSKGT